MKIDGVMYNAEIHDILDELKTEMDLNGTGLFSKGFSDSGDNCMCQCIYHANGQERRPSAGIHKDTGIYHCFACGETRSLPEVISNCFGYNDFGLFGKEWLLKNFASISIETRKDLNLDVKRNNSMDNSVPDNTVGYVSEEELDKYRYYHPYMYKRKLTDEIINMFDIGYDSDTDSITFPVRDVNGNTLFIARRSVKGKRFNYPVKTHKPLYGVYELNKYAKDCTEVIVCESMLDALACWVYGKYAVAMNGLGTDTQYKQLSELPCRKLVLATDNDQAGRIARVRLRLHVTNKIITEYVIPDGKKDINDLSKEEFDNLKEVF